MNFNSKKLLSSLLFLILSHALAAAPLELNVDANEFCIIRDDAKKDQDYHKKTLEKEAFGLRQTDNPQQSFYYQFDIEKYYKDISASHEANLDALCKPGFGQEVLTFYCQKFPSESICAKPMGYKITAEDIYKVSEVSCQEKCAQNIPAKGVRDFNKTVAVNECKFACSSNINHWRNEALGNAKYKEMSKKNLAEICSLFPESSLGSVAKPFTRHDLIEKVTCGHQDLNLPVLKIYEKKLLVSTFPEAKRDDYFAMAANKYQQFLNTTCTNLSMTGEIIEYKLLGNCLRSCDGGKSFLTAGKKDDLIVIAKGSLTNKSEYYLEKDCHYACYRFAEDIERYRKGFITALDKATVYNDECKRSKTNVNDGRKKRVAPETPAPSEKANKARSL